MKYQYLLFDLDGTLTDSQEGILCCVQYALEKLGCPERDEQKLYPFIGPPLIYSFQEYTKMPYETAVEAVRLYRERFSTIGLFENRVYDGVIEMLDSLQKQGYTLALATSKPHPYTLRILEHFHLTEYFTKIVGADLQREDQTKTDIIRLCLEQLQLQESDYSNCVMIGDRRHDAEGAKAVGLDFLGAGYGYAPQGELESFHPIGIANSPLEIINFV